MKSYLAVLIAAVTVNCLVTTINGTPVKNMFLPPLGDIQDNSNDVASTSLQQDKTTAASTTTQNPLTIGLPELSIEALLPPLFEAKIEKDEEDDKTQQTKNKITTTTQKPTTTTTTTTRKSTTVKPTTTTTKVEVPDLFLDALLPPLFDNTVDNTLNIQGVDKTNTKTSTTKKPLIEASISKTTKKSYYQQQTEHLKDLHLIDQDETHPKTYEKQQQQLKNLQQSTTATKNYNKQKNPSQSTSDKQVAESTAQVAKTTQYNLHSNIEKLTSQHVAKQVIQQKYKISSSNYDKNDPRQFNYSFDFYLGSTTAKPPNSGLPTITPFPHRLG